jgi:hypothetical protein
VRATGAWWPRMSANCASRPPSGDGALLLEFESGFFASRQVPTGERHVRDAAAGAEPVQRRDLPDVLVAPVQGATVWSAPPQ